MGVEGLFISIFLGVFAFVIGWLIGSEDENKRINISIETIEIFSPLAHRLGMKEWQDELEDLAFQSINQEARKSVIDRLNYLNSNDENIVDEIRYELKKNLISEDINCNIE